MLLAPRPRFTFYAVLTPLLQGVVRRCAQGAIGHGPGHAGGGRGADLAGQVSLLPVSAFAGGCWAGPLSTCCCSCARLVARHPLPYPPHELAAPRMTKDPRAVEQDYSQGARQDVVSHGGSER